MTTLALNANEYSELQRLMFHAQSGRLGPFEEQRLRFLLAKQNPNAAAMNMEDLVRLGLFVLGLWAFLKLMSR